MSPARDTVKLVLALLAATALLVLASGCGRDEPDLSSGKALFVQKCGSCHELSRADTQGKTGPNLDESFETALREGFNRETVKGIVQRQIDNPLNNSKMPAGLVKGKDASDVSAYVAKVAGRSGEDSGALAQAGLAGATSGKQIYTAAGCGSCHKLADAASNGATGPSLDELAQAASERKPGTEAEGYVLESLTQPDAFTVEGFAKGVMPSYEGKLSDKQLDALVKYLLEASGGG